MSEADFNAILDTQASEIVAKPPVPVGSYEAKIVKLDHVVSSQKKTPGIEFKVILTSPIEVSDTDALLESGALGKKEFNLTFWTTADSASMLKEFLVNVLGIDDTGKTIRQMLAETLNATLGVVVTHGLSKNGRAFAQIDSSSAMKLA